jgi:transposase
MQIGCLNLTLNETGISSLDNHPVDEIISIFGYSSRQSFYTALHSFKKEGMEALIPKSTGPQRSYRRTEKVEQRIIQIRFDDRTKDMYEIANILQEEDCKISARSVARTLSNYGITLKKTKKRPS